MVYVKSDWMKEEMNEWMNEYGALVERYWPEKPEVLGGTLQHSHFIQHQSHTDRPVIENELPRLPIPIFVIIHSEDYSSEDLHVILMSEISN